MAQKIIFQDSFLVSGIMCHQGCGMTIQSYLTHFEDLKKAQLLPEDAQLIIDSEPQALGVHRLFIMIESDAQEFQQDEEKQKQLSKQFKDSLNAIGYEVIESTETLADDKTTKVNWMNILINIGSMLGLLALYFIFPPSLPLTIASMALSFITTAFTARSYLGNFYRNLRNKDLMNMATPVTLGWLLSFTHSLYHSIMMPMVTSFSMAFMSFMMPVLLIGIMNGIDEIKRLVLNKSKKMHLKGLKNLFPQMAESYPCYQISEQHQELLSHFVLASSSNELPINFDQTLVDLLRDIPVSMHPKNSLKKNTIITVKAGECFPVDGVIIQGNTLVDISILTGEPQQHRQIRDFIPAGAINLGSEVKIYAMENCYNSAVNKLLFRSNRAQEALSSVKSEHVFGYLYTGLIIASLGAAIIAPFILGILTIPLALQNITGILFAICPCTITIAHQLPKLLSIYSRSKKGIILRDEYVTERATDIQTVVFDKTGTLTTGNSQVAASEGISSNLWQRIYLLEKHHGAEHPLAKAIYKHYEAQGGMLSIINDIHNVTRDAKHRGLSAIVQGKSIHIGSADFMERSNIRLPQQFSETIQHKLEQGYTLLYVAEDSVYQGIILIKHEIRKDVLKTLLKLKKEGKKLIMLTGDSRMAAHGFNQQNGSIFDPENIHTEQTPQDKETFLSQSIADKEVWFVGDGLNDAPCARIVSEQGGISFAMNTSDKAAFFTDISLNGSLDYLSKHNKLNQFAKKNTLQNQGFTVYSTLVFLAFIISFSTVGIAVSPLIPMVIMLSTTLFTLFNSYRVTLSIDVALDKKSSWLKQYLASDASIGVLVSGSTLLMLSILIATITTGGLAFPAIIFTAGVLASLNSISVLAAGFLFASFALPGLAYLIDTCRRTDAKETVIVIPPSPPREQPGPLALKDREPGHSSGLNFGLAQTEAPSQVREKISEVISSYN